MHVKNPNASVTYDRPFVIAEYAMPILDDHQVPPEPVPDNDPLPDEKPTPDDDPVPDHHPVSLPRADTR